LVPSALVHVLAWAVVRSRLAKLANIKLWDKKDFGVLFFISLGFGVVKKLNRGHPED
jgi:hypothetical protein